jgi:hypothetical protein
MKITEGQTMVKVVASDTPTVVEIGEVISWLATACRLSPEPNNIAYISAEVAPEPQQGKIVVTHQVIEDTRAPLDESNMHACWQYIFKNPVVCEGYPIELRHNDEKGLQISLDVMAALGCTKTITMYGQNLIMKGVCSAFLPVLKVGTSVIWHYLVNEDLSWMSYNIVHEHDHRISDLHFKELESLSHFVGWSRCVRENIGGYFLCQ